MKRRSLLSVCATAMVGGCYGVGQESQSRLAWIWLQNDRNEVYEVDVVVENAGETVFSDAYQLTAGSDIRIDTPVDGPGQYVIRATMDGETRTVETTTLIHGNENCVGVRFSLLDNGSVDYWTKSMQEC